MYNWILAQTLLITNLNLTTPVSCHLIPDMLILKTQSKQQISVLLYQISSHLHPRWWKTDSKINPFGDVKHFTIIHNLIIFNIKFQQRKNRLFFIGKGRSNQISPGPVIAWLSDASLYGFVRCHQWKIEYASLLAQALSVIQIDFRIPDEMWASIMLRKAPPPEWLWP